MTRLPLKPGAPALNRLFASGLHTLQIEISKAFTPPFSCSVHCCNSFDGNQRTSRFMMNGILMSSGIDAVSIPAAKRLAFNDKMLRYTWQRMQLR